MKKIIIPALVAMTLIACDSNKSNQVEKENIKLNYPETRKGDQVDTYFGVDINDPYRWLEDDMSEETKEWVKAQNEVTFSYLNSIAYKNEISNKLEKLWNYEKVGSPFVRGDYTYYYKNDGYE